MRVENKAGTLVAVTIYGERGRIPELLNALRMQDKPVDGVLIIDNSPQPFFSELFLPRAEDLQVCVIHKPENIGVSGAISMALNWARERNFRYLWLMDHDSIPSAACHGLLLSKLHASLDVALVACQPVIEPDGKLLPGLIFKNFRFLRKKASLAANSGYVEDYECDAVITAGSLISIQRVEGLNIVDESLFIDAVDHDLCWRIRSSGFKIIVVGSALMSHQLGSYKEIKDRLKKRTVQLSSYSYIRLYYICRNHTIVEVKASRGFWKLMAILWRVKFCLWQIRMNFLECDDFRRKSIYSLLGLFHGLLNRTGKHRLSSPPSALNQRFRDNSLKNS